MIESKHTPGPWKASRAFIENAPDRLIVTDGKWGSPALAWLPAARDADAQLIAAAPDLLKALEVALEYLEANPDDYSEPRAKAARAAIAKARGVEA
jgi:hypothetical protein